MSLKAFHIFFIALSVAMAFGFSAWLIAGYIKGTGTVDLAGGVLSFLGGIGLILYGIRFLKKLKHVSFL